MDCPICGAKDIPSAVRCRKYPMSVCWDHCKSCDFFRGFDASGPFCGIDFERDPVRERRKQKNTDKLRN